jgi:16S rRNA (guanine966-N2)-methyltransferase
MGFLRVVGGALRGRRLRVPDRGVRPTSERVREAVFDILGARVPGARVLDLFAGTGALGIEALSRGAASAAFVEGDRAVARVLEGNLGRLGLSDRASVAVAPLEGARLPAALAGPWDLVFLDPPYAGEAGARWLAALASAPWPPSGGLIVLERRRGTLAAPEGIVLLTERRYGDTVVGIYHAGPQGAPRTGGA